MTEATIISDASVCPKSGANGYAFWAVSGRGRFCGEGSFKTAVVDTVAAEAMGAINALYCALRAGVIATGDRVLVQVDNLAVPAVLAGAMKRKRSLARYAPLRSAFDGLSLRYSIQVRFRHVRGHSAQNTPRFAAQKLCDRAARRRMRQMRSRLAASPQDPGSRSGTSPTKIS